jgi:3-methyladenine DNA glycosylase AlkC
VSDLKHLVSKKSLSPFLNSLVSVYPKFDRAGFDRRLVRDLSGLELKARVDFTARLLHGFLPEDYARSLSILVRAVKRDPGVEGFPLWPVTHFVMLYGTDIRDYEASMEALKFLTTRFTAEWAVRPFFMLHREKTLRLFREWASDENEHVRRWVSEGSRPLLPWGPRLVDFFEEPKWGLELLEVLKHDESEYVRKSVANHLNDFSKKHPDRVVRTLRRWKKEAPEAHMKKVDWVARHATRTLLKQGHVGAMALQGLKPIQARITGVRFKSKKIAMGEALEMTFRLSTDSNGKAMIDYAIHHRKANGSLQPKVFKHSVREVRESNDQNLLLKHAFRPISTRKYYSGTHAIEIFVNGQSAWYGEFDLDTRNSA